MEKILTVTVPAYNAEKTLDACLSSLCLPEAIDRLDVIVINDGSTDSTEKAAQKYAERFPESVRLISKENGGHGSGINRGISEAHGRYFKVLDADDSFDREGLLELLHFLESSSEVDLVSTQFLWVINKGSESCPHLVCRAQFKEPFAGVEYQRSYPLETVAEKLYVKFHNLTVKTELLRKHQIVMDEHCYYEDAEYALYPFAFAKTIAFTEKPLYMYSIGVAGQSMSKEKLLKNVKNYDLVLEALLKFMDSHELSGSIKDYFERTIARFYASRIKIGLCMPIGEESKKMLVSMEQSLLAFYPEVYHKNSNRALRALRASRWMLYLPAALLIRIRGTI